MSPTKDYFTVGFSVVEISKTSIHRGKPRLIFWIMVATLFYCPSLGWPKAFEPYESRSEFLPTSPASTLRGLRGYLNPALAHTDGSGTIFSLSDRKTKPRGGMQWGLFTGLPHLGFGMVHRSLPGRDLTDYNIAIASGDRSGSFGLSYGWSSGSTRRNGRENRFAAGTVLRPSQRMALGITVVFTADADVHETVVDFAVRPRVSPRLTLFAEAATDNNKAGGTEYWSGGGTIEVIDGVLLTGRCFANRTVSLGLEIGLGRTAVNTQSRLDGTRRKFNTYSTRIGPRQASALARYFQREPKYLELSFDRPTGHRRFLLFDPSQTLANVVQTIGRARTDPSIRGLALNLSGLRMPFAMSWELRETLQEFRASGKRVIAYVDRSNIVGYHLASVADRIYMDPVGMLSLEGFVAGRTYFEGSLKKLGLGFDEWRLFKYKSALETLSRHEMSDPDREQWTNLIDDFYELVQQDICAARDLSLADFNRLVDNETVLLPQDALDSGLVDSLNRWDEVVRNLEGRKGHVAPASNYEPIRPSPWEPKPRVAVVYVLGVCAMDSGIRARSLSKDLASIKNDRNIDAVVLRVDSPGGDGLASDLVAEEVNKIRQEKPVVVSLGSVAASGGYWLSMNADSIVAAPNTITGSIGVIGGWLYNLELKEKLGLTTDHVKIGDHADLTFGASVPLLGMLPDRNLDAHEKKTMERLMRSLYGTFVDKVSRSRGLTADEVEMSAQGRLWSGKQAMKRGLVDELGGLNRAIRIAAEKAGIDEQDHIELVEYPRLPPFDPRLFRPQLLSAEHKRFGDYLKFRVEHNGQALVLMPGSFTNSFAHTVPQAEPLSTFGRTGR